MPMGPATIEAVFVRKGRSGEVRYGDGLVIFVRTDKEEALLSAAAELGKRLRGQGFSPRRIAIRDTEGVAMVMHELAPDEARNAQPAAASPAPDSSPPPKEKAAVADPVETKGSNVGPAVVQEHYRLITKTFHAMQKAQGEHRAAFAAAKKAGINIDALKNFIALSKMDEDDRTALLKNTHAYSQWLGRPVGFQPALFGEVEAVPEKAAAEHNEWLAEEAGFEAGKRGDAGGADQSPYPAASAYQVAWQRGWERGALEIAPGGVKSKGGARRDSGNPEDAATAGEPPRRGQRRKVH
jgi:hypothetical protein